MGFKLRDFSKVSEKIRSSGHFKYLLAIPFLMVVALGSYKLGHSSEIVPRNQEEGAELLHRQRRDVVTDNSRIIETHSGINPGGAVYTQWGRKECSSGSEEIYVGIVGGSWFQSHGGGSNYLCLPMDPIWDNYNEAVEKASKLHGAEFESPYGFNLENNGGRSLHDHNVPCAVCRSQTKTSVVMIPARNLCYDGWKTEYSGYLMSSHPAHNGRTQFVCVDKSPESDPAGYRDENGALFYSVEGVCGSLPCPPYVQRREITCVVCSK